MSMNYPLYHHLSVDSLKDMIYAWKHKGSEREGIAVLNRERVVEKASCRRIVEDVERIGAWILRRGYWNRRIGIMGANSCEWLVIFMATVCCGHIAVALDRELSVEELDKALKKTDTHILFCDKAALTKAEKLSGDYEIHTFDEVREILQAEHDVTEVDRETYRNIPLDLDAPCCIFFTSGTSSERKAVMLSHRNLAADINGACKLFELTGDTYAILPFHHAFGLVVAVLMVLNYGHTVYIGSGLKRMRRELPIAKPQTMMLVPLFIENFHKQIWDAAKKAGKEKRLRRVMRISDVLLRIGIDLRRRLFREVLAPFGGKLEYIICGGAPLDARYVKEFRSFGIEILNGYGTTECSPVAAVNRNHHHKDGTVGLPLPDSEVRIAEDGEVLIWGDHVFLGYYHDEEATKAVLHDGWYATGDLGSLDKDGFLTLYGRKKNLIILSNGENVSPEELEEQLYRIDGIDEVLVSGEDGVIAAEIYTAAKTEEVKKKIDTAVAMLNRTLPTYKRIARLRFRDTPFEKTTTRKIKRRED